MSPGPLIAEFASARDAQLFAGLKREIGEPVCVTAGIHQVYGVRVCSDALIDQLFGEGFRQLGYGVVCVVAEPALTALESALAEAGYDLTDEELAQSEEQRGG